MRVYIMCLGPEPMRHIALFPPPDPFPTRGFDFRVVLGDPQEVEVELLDWHAGLDLVEELQHRRLVPHAPLLVSCQLAPPRS